MPSFAMTAPGPVCGSQAREPAARCPEAAGNAGESAGSRRASGALPSHLAQAFTKLVANGGWDRKGRGILVAGKPSGSRPRLYVGSRPIGALPHVPPSRRAGLATVAARAKAARPSAQGGTSMARHRTPVQGALPAAAIAWPDAAIHLSAAGQNTAPPAVPGRPLCRRGIRCWLAEGHSLFVVALVAGTIAMAEKDESRANRWPRESINRSPGHTVP